MNIRKRNIEPIPFKGLRPDNPTPGSFTKLVNAELRGGVLYQRAPRNATNAADSVGAGNYYKSIFEFEDSDDNKHVLVDVPYTSVSNYLKVVAGTNIGTNRLISISSYSNVLVSLTNNANVIPDYERGQGGAYRVDGVNDNKIIENTTTTHDCGVDAPTEPPGFQIGTIEGGGSSVVEIPPCLVGTCSGFPLGDSTSTIDAGLHYFEMQLVGVESSVQYKGPSFQDQAAYNPHMGWSFLGNQTYRLTWKRDFYDELVTVGEIYDDLKLRIYMTLKDVDPTSPTYYLVEEVSASTMPNGYIIDMSDAVLATHGTLGGTPPSASVRSQIYEKTDYEFYYIYVKKYNSGDIVFSNPSPPATLNTIKQNLFTVTYGTSADPDVTHIWIYRNLFGQLGTYFKAKEITNAGSSTTVDATDEELTDEDEVLEFDNDKPPKCKHICQALGQMVYLNLPDAVNGASFFRFSKTDEHEHCPTGNEVSFDPDSGGGITGAIYSGGNLVVFKKNQTRKYIPVYPFSAAMDCSKQIGLVDSRTLQPVGKNVVAGLGMNGCWIFDTVNFVNITEFKIQETIIQDYVDNKAIFHSAYYPELNQYHLVMFTMTGDNINNHRYLVCDIGSLEWFESTFTDASGNQLFDVCLGKATDENGRQVVLSGTLTGKDGTSLILYQNDITPDLSSYSNDTITEVATNKAWKSVIASDKDCWFLGKDQDANNEDELWHLYWNGSGYNAVCDHMTPGGGLYDLKIGGDILYLKCASATGSSKFYTKDVSGGGFSGPYDPDIDSNNIYVESYRIGMEANNSDDLFFTFFKPGAYNKWSLATENALGYSEGDIVYEKDYRRVKEYAGRELFTSQYPTNGNILHIAWPFPAVLDALSNWLFNAIYRETMYGEAPYQYNILQDYAFAYYMYDITGTLSDLDTIKFEGIWFGVDSGDLNENTTYTVHQVVGDIYTVHEGAGDALKIGGLFDGVNDGTESGYIYKKQDFNNHKTVKWLPSADTFTMGDVRTYYKHTWEYLDLYDYLQPFIGTLISGSIAYFINDFEVGDAIYGKSFYKLYISPTEEYIYFLRFDKTDLKYYVSRIDSTDATATIEIEDIFEFNPGYTNGEATTDVDSIQLYVTTDKEIIYIYNGINITKHEYNYGWASTRESQDINAREIIYDGNLDVFWVTYDSGSRGIVKMLDKQFNEYQVRDDSEVLPYGLHGMSVIDGENMLIVCHGEGYYSGDTVYLIEKNEYIYEITQENIINNYPTEPTLHGVVMELQSAFLDLGLDHIVKRQLKGYSTLESRAGAVGIFSVEPDINVSEKTHETGEASGPDESQDIMYCQGIPDWESDEFDYTKEPFRKNELEVYLSRDSVNFRWATRIGDMINNRHSAIKFKPPSFQMQISGEMQDDEEE